MSNWSSEVDRHGTAFLRVLEELMEQRSHVEVLEVRQSGLVERRGDELGQLALRVQQVGCVLTSTSMGHSVVMLDCLDSRHEMVHWEEGDHSCHFDIRLFPLVAGKSLERLHSCRTPGEVELALEIDPCSSEVLVRVLLAKVIVWVGSRTDCEQAGMLASENQVKWLRWRGLDVQEGRSAWRCCSRLAQKHEETVIASMCCFDKQDGRHVEEECEILVGTHHGCRYHEGASTVV